MNSSGEIYAVKFSVGNSVFFEQFKEICVYNFLHYEKESRA